MSASPVQKSIGCSGLFRILLVLSLAAAFPALAFEIPKGLNRSDRREIVRTLGMNSASKILSNPFPLGGYSGFEMGYSLELINIRELRRVGCEPGSPGCANRGYSDESEWRYSRFTVGKGIYNDVDLFMHFIPPLGNVGVSGYGGVLRWSFYEARFLPINVSALVYGDQLNYHDDFVNRNLGADLIVGINVDSFSLYFGGGRVYSRGTFIGPALDNTCGENCTSGPDDEMNLATRTLNERVDELHTVIGFSLHFLNLFVAAEVDRYRDSVYSGKAGLRF